MDYVRDVLLPTLAPMGVDVTCNLTAWGFYPVGGGELQVTISPVAGPLPSPCGWRSGGHWRDQPGRCGRSCGTARSHRPAHWQPGAECSASGSVARYHSPERVRGKSAGAGIFLVARYAHSRAGFSALGRQGKPSDAVADEACEALLTHHIPGAPVDPHLADILVPLVLADERSVFRTSRITQHLLTNAQIIRAFVAAEIVIDGAEGEPGTVTVEGIGQRSTGVIE